MKHLGRTPPIRGSSAAIAEVAYVRLGGVDQWVMMRGENSANPPLIFLHGGPGMSEMRFVRHYNWPLEAGFTVVNWDQRGTAKSFDRAIPRSTMNVEQFLSDLDELVDRVRERLGHEKVALFGHSWGSALGVLYAARFPSKVSVYAGSGQVGDWPAAEAASYAWTLAEAERRGDPRALRELRAIGPPPYPARSVWTERMWGARFEGNTRLAAMWQVGRVLFGGAESSLLDVPNFVLGFRFSLDAMWSEVSALNLIELVPKLPMPVFFLLGRRDRMVPAHTSAAYFEALQAPAKQLIWFEQSGHEPFVDEPERFNTAMLSLVRPLAVAAQPSAGVAMHTRSDAFAR